MNNVRQIYKECASSLVQKREGDLWKGRLSSSALAVSVAITAFAMYDSNLLKQQIKDGVRWLIATQNGDGGYGDSPQSISNISTTLLCYAALTICDDQKESRVARGRICLYLYRQDIDMKRDFVERSVLDHYGRDLTFSVPILTMLAICGVIDDFEKIPQLPFEFSLLPRSLFRFFNLQVVSYAIPALIAVGIVCLKKKRKSNPFLRFIRYRLVKKALCRLQSLMPQSGGFLEAVPLTGFVSLSLLAAGVRNQTVERGISFLKKIQRSDGSFPIDTDLSLWVTTLSIKALNDNLNTSCGQEAIERLRNILLNSQYRQVHPFNGAKPGGWGWTTFSGAVPDADDTSGAILALAILSDGSAEVKRSIKLGCDWLISLQNRDGGVPTFCKGWGRLPFDKSCADLTAHACAAIIRSRYYLNGVITNNTARCYGRFINRALGYLEKNQSSTGALLPLWFGNQDHPEHKNPVYGSAKISVYLRDSLQFVCEDSQEYRRIYKLADKACRYLESCQNEDGGWGAASGIKSTLEESALSVSALTSFNRDRAVRGVDYLLSAIKINGITASPIGLYFASLWYDEELYPHVFLTEALGRYIRTADNGCTENLDKLEKM
ncbi:MAG: squalene--hopene cyclase [Spirochaetes bacterium]|nr:squalene--hopene cyclase [Spirochaetota bacterium]MBN2769587.1 squalene--hopene cyclase [Spirochaetota bacterium]